jgi:subtilase family serine protease
MIFAALAVALLIASHTGRTEKTAATTVAAVPGLIAWLPADWHANDMQGTNHGTLKGGAVYAPGKVNQSFGLSGNGDYVDVQGSPAVGALASLTVAAWINPQRPNAANSVGTVFATRRPMVSEGFILSVTSEGALSIGIKTDGHTIYGVGFVTDPSIIRFDNYFKHVAITYDAGAGALKAYVDGSEVALRNPGNATLGGPIDNPDNFYLGQRQNANLEGPQGAAYFYGTIDEFRLFDRALTPSEILETADALVVTNTADSGPGSLRQAILDANAATGTQIIAFDIPGAGVQTIAPLSPLPEITGTVRIDGYTQPGARPNTLAVGSDAVPLIELSGANLSNANGLELQSTANNSVVRGLVINRFNGIGLEVWSGGNILEGNFIGTDATGTIARSNSNGLRVISGNANNNLIGGTSPAARNVISGNRFYGIITAFHHSGTRIQGNYIGTNAAGMAALGNGSTGISLDNPATVGGLEPGAGNVISANGGNGIELKSSPSAVFGNLIGTRADGTGDLGNWDYGIYVGTGNIVLGGTEAGAANTVAFNGRGGIGLIWSLGATSISGNSIYANKTRSGGSGLGIDLADDGVTPNDSGDGDSGPNRRQNFPTIDLANSNGTATTVQGTLNSEANTTYTLHFYSNAECDPSGHGEGQTYLGSTTATTGDGVNNVNFSVSFPVVVAQGQFITATATHPANGTSEFSPCRAGSFTRPPDLHVSALNAPPQALTDAAFDLSWTLTNGGEEAANGPWADRVFLSSDERLDGGDTRLANFPFTQSISPGQSAGRVQSITIPRAAVAQDGQYYLIVFTDADNAVIEGSAEGNNFRAVPLTVSRSLLPDLIVDGIEAPAAPFFDQKITVRWGVKNVGNASTNAPEWADRVFLSSDQVLDIDDITHNAVPNVSYLAPGERYEATAEFHLPRGFTGAYYLFVQTDANAQLTEYNEGNNAQLKPISIQIPPLPDLSVTLVQGPQQAVAGGDIFVNWRVENRGAADTRPDQPHWVDGFYLSKDQVFSPSTDRFVGSLTRGTGTLARGEGYTVTGHKIELPRDIAGQWYLFVTADQGNAVYEFANESNNAARDERHPINIVATPPDLTASAVEAATSAVAGQAITVSFTVTNQGAFAAGGHWQDSVFLSADATLDPASDTLLQTVVRNGGLDPATSYGVAPSVTLPHCIDGTYYLFALTDRTNQVFEFASDYDAERNNSGAARQIRITSAPPDLQVTTLDAPNAGTAGQPLSLTWTVTNAGSGPAMRSPSVDRIYLSQSPALDTRVALFVASFVRTDALAVGESYTRAETVTLPPNAHGLYHLFIQTDAADEIKECAGEGNNARAAAPALDVNNSLPDLTVTTIDAPTEVFANQTISVQWSGRNNGTGAAGQSGWKDAVYLSADATLEEKEKPLALSIVGGPLAVGGSYSAQAQLKLPSVPAGDYFLFVKADAERFVFEGAREDNNNGVRAVRVRVPDVDLRVTNLSALADAPSGDSVNVGWTVTNAGASETLASEWSDYVLLSRDQIADPTDTVVGYRQRSQPLAAGQSYEASVAAEIPPGLSGQYYLFVRSDRNGAVAELDERNNDSMPHGLLLRLPPPVDLTAHSLVAPASGFVGEAFALNWRVQNTGDNQTPSQWTDAVYLSADPAWDSADILLARAPNRSALAPGQSYDGFVGGLLPPVNPGQYYIIVRADVRNRVREVSEANNVAATTTPSLIDVRELPLGTPVTRQSMTAGQELYFKTGAPTGETLLYTLDSTGNASTEMFARHNSIVSPSAFDFASDRPNEGDQEIVIPTALDGLYYNLSRILYVAPLPDADNRPVAASTSVTVKAEVIPFGIRSVSPQRIGDNGQVTLTLRGAKFAEGATVQLVANGTTLTASNVTVLDGGTTAKARFHFTNAPHGTYDVALSNLDGSSTTADGATTVESARPFRVSLNLNGNTHPRIGTQTTYDASIENTGNLDIPYVTVRVKAEDKVGMILDRPADALPRLTDYPEYNPQDGAPFILHLPEETLGTFLLRNVEVGQEVPFRVAIKDFGRRPFPFNVDARSFTTDTYVSRMKVQVEQMRQKLLARPDAGLPPELYSMLDDADAWWNFFAGAFVRFGYFDTVLVAADHSAKGQIIKPNSHENGCTPGEISETFIDCADAMVDVFQDCARKSLRGQFEKCAYSASMGADECGNGGLEYYDCVHNPPPLDCDAVMIHNLFSLSGQDSISGLICALFPGDPNEKSGPSGYGAQAFIGLQQPLPYTVNFENVPTATAAAQQITITDQLDANLDWRTLRLREIGFGKYRVAVPENRAYHQARVPLGTDLGNLHADISAFLDVTTGRVMWTLTAIDPATGEQPNGALQGLLPPNDETGRGQGFVTYTVRAKAGAPTGTQITNRATIVFDTEEPITTNTVSNTLDSDAPASSVAALPASSQPTFAVSWSGTDPANGSGLHSYDIYVSEGEGPFEPFVSGTEETSAQFTGQPGSTYRFYSVARDNAGNAEAAPAAPDATTTVVSAQISLSSLALNPTVVMGGESAQGTVTLSSPAGQGGAQIILGSSHAAVVVPAQVTVPEGASSAVFTITTGAVAAETQANISATFNGVTQGANLIVKVPPGLSVIDAAVAEPKTGTANATFKVNLSAAATQAVTVSYETADDTATSSDDYAYTAGTLTFAPGETSQSFNVAVNADGNTEGIETFFVNISAPTGAVIFDGQGVGAISPPISAGQLLISEFRFRGPRGANDEFVELYNNTDADINVATDDGSNGWALVASDGVVRGVIPNSTVLPARGHYLFTNSSFCPEINNNCYSLAAHAGGDQGYTADIADGSGVALFKTSDASNFTLASRLDAVGFAPSDALYREGDGLTPAVDVDAEHSFVRRLTTGTPQDSGEGATDFMLVSTGIVPLGGAQPALGAPGPENLSSPVQRNSVIKSSLIDPQCAAFGSTTSACARVRTAEGANPQNAAYGTLRIRRKFTNKTGANVTRLRFRVVDITTTPETGVADLRVIGGAGSFDVTDMNGNTVTIERLTLEQSPVQANGGGLNSTVSAGTITFNTPIIPNSSINVEFLMGVMQNGSFRFLLNVEALPGTSGGSLTSQPNMKTNATKATTSRRQK